MELVQIPWIVLHWIKRMQFIHVSPCFNRPCAPEQIAAPTPADPAHSSHSVVLPTKVMEDKRKKGIFRVDPKGLWTVIVHIWLNVTQF